MTLMTRNEIQVGLKKCPDWIMEDDVSISLNWKGDHFRQAFDLMTEIAKVADELNHHPEWFNVYSRLTIRLTTHNKGGLTLLDFTMAERIDALIQLSEVGTSNF